MNLRAFSLLGAISAFLAPSLAPSTASAQDGPRFRGGVGLETGPLVLTAGSSDEGASVVGMVGLTGQLGVQISHNWAVYAQPSVDFVFTGGGPLGFVAGGAVLAEYTFSGAPISIGAGPSAGAFGSAGIGDGDGFGLAPFYGGKLHFAWYPVLNEGYGGRRNALYLALDLNVQGTSESGASGAVLLSPLASIGYQAF
jgi:hypothetical protein